MMFDTLSPLYDWGLCRLRTMDELSRVSGEPCAVVVRDCDDDSCGSCWCRRPTTHWGRFRSASEHDGYWAEWCDRHGLLGTDADAVVVGDKMLFEPESVA